MATSSKSKGKRIPSLSPTRASDFKMCPARYKFKHVLRIPEAPTKGMASGILVHAVLERLHALPPADRTRIRAAALQSELVADGGEWDGLEEADLKKCAVFLDNYWTLEDPTQVRSEVREWRIEMALEGLLLRGVIDRADRVDTEMMLTDYKTGRTPGEAWEMKAFFGLRIYALLVWKLTGQMPAAIRLMYLDDPTVLMIQPSEMMLRAMEKQLHALSDAIVRAGEQDDWKPRPSKVCSWCPYVRLCPAWEGVQIPDEWVERLDAADAFRDQAQPSA